MWKETMVIENVGHNNFDARSGVFATYEGEKKTVLHIGGKEISVNKIIKVMSFDDKVIVFAIDDVGHNDALLFTKDGELINKVKCTAIAVNNVNLRYLNIIEYKNYINYFNLVEFETGRVIFGEYIPQRELFVFNDMIFSNEDNIIIRHGWDGSILWQHDYQPDFNVEIDLGSWFEGVCGGKLWVKSKHDRHEILLAIDVNTGELVKAFSDSEEDTNLPHCNLGEIDGSYINVENDHILVLAYDEDYNLFMNFVNAKTLEVFEKTDYAIDYDYDNGEKYSIGITGFQGDYITFILSCLHIDGMPSGFAVYNYKKKEVVFAHRLFTPEQTKKGRYLWGNTTRIPFYNNGLIFVHDNCDTLHIFEDVKE